MGSVPLGRGLVALLLLGGGLALGRPPAGPLPGEQDYLGEPIRYEDPAREDPVARLAAGLADGSLELAWHPERGYLDAVLAALGAPVESQLLVFSKTSFQDTLISPRTPRAVYFGEGVAVGFLPGAPLMELTGVDPVQGPTYYTLDQRREAPRVRRRDGECLQCHGGHMTGYWPGHLVRSVHPDASGFPVQRAGSRLVTLETPFAERWGGWYVTGTHGDATHLGNLVVAEGALELAPQPGPNVTDLSGRFETARYPSPHSDLVALLVYEHIAEMENRIARASYKARRALAHRASMEAALGGPSEHVSATAEKRLALAAADLVDGLLFRGEAPLPGPLAGTSGFAEVWTAAGRRDAAGRSLSDLDLERRLLRYPCSPLVHSAAFSRLPAPLLEEVWAELDAILAGRDVGRSFDHLDAADRAAIRELLVATCAALPSEWGRTAPAGD